MKRPAEKTEPAPNSRAGIPSVLLRASTRLLGGCSILWLTRHLPGAVPEEARFLVNQALQLLQDHQVLVCSPRLNEVSRDRLSPILYGDQDQLYGDASRRIRKRNPRGQSLVMVA
jgi:hypothetical protein